jgi:hypothetical protein
VIVLSPWGIILINDSPKIIFNGRSKGSKIHFTFYACTTTTAYGSEKGREGYISRERVGKRRMAHFEYVATEENKEDVQPMYLSQKKSLQQKRLDIYTTAIIQ